MLLENGTLPTLDDGTVEIQIAGDEVCIYASDDGLLGLMSLCDRLIKRPGQGHIHVEDYSLLTTKSLRCVLVRVRRSD